MLGADEHDSRRELRLADVEESRELIWVVESMVRCAAH
jgi:hypothetical protein